MTIKNLFIIFFMMTINIWGIDYPTETINKNSFVTETFGGIEQANTFRKFRDEILLDSKEGKEYINTFYKILSSLADVMIHDADLRRETTERLFLISKEVKKSLENNKISTKMGDHINYLLDSYASSTFTNTKLIKTINNIKTDHPILKFIEQYNSRKLTKNLTPYIKYEIDSILVAFKPNININSIPKILENTYDLNIKEVYNEIGIYNVSIPKKYKDNIENLITTLNQNSNIEFAEPNGIVSAFRSPNDKLYNQQWGLNNVGQKAGTYGVDIDAEKAWNKTIGKHSVIVAVIDTGVSYNHPELRKNMWINTKEIPNNKKDDDHNGYIDDVRGWDFVNNDNNPLDDNNHGSHCSGIIGAKSNNHLGVTGVNWNVRIMPLKFLDSCGNGKDSDAIKAIIYAANMGAKIVSNSWGGGSYNKAMVRAIQYLSKKGGLFIAAAGNGKQKGDQDNHITNVGIDNDKEPMYPASYTLSNIISVAAIDRNDELASFSNYGKKSVDLAAPGVDILSTARSGYKLMSGTSMATPYVAGVAALIKSINPKLNYSQIKKRILKNVHKTYQLEGKVSSGGRLNAFNSIINSVPPTYGFLIPIWHNILF